MKPKFKILLVDDNKDFLKVIHKVLVTYFISMIDLIEQASNGEECIKLIEKNSYDIIFMDIEMPGMNGIEATKFITEHFRGIKVIALSTKHELSDIQDMIEAGARNFIIKDQLKKEYLSELFARF